MGFSGPAPFNDEPKITERASSAQVENVVGRERQLLLRPTRSSVLSFIIPTLRELSL
jgi:hypothetical protein